MSRHSVSASTAIPVRNDIEQDAIPAPLLDRAPTSEQDRIRHRCRGHSGDLARRRVRMEQRSRHSTPGARHAAADRPMTGWRSQDEGMATLETTLMVVILVPLL